MKEKEIESQILSWLNFQPGIFAFKINTVGVYDSIRKVYRKNLNPFCLNGVSDILAVYKGRMLCIEVKSKAKRNSIDSPKTQTERDQAYFLNVMKTHDAFTLVAHNLDQVIEFIETIKNLI